MLLWRWMEEDQMFELRAGNRDNSVLRVHTVYYSSRGPQSGAQYPGYTVRWLCDYSAMGSDVSDLCGYLHVHITLTYMYF